MQSGKIHLPALKIVFDSCPGGDFAKSHSYPNYFTGKITSDVSHAGIFLHKEPWP